MGKAHSAIGAELTDSTKTEILNEIAPHLKEWDEKKSIIITNGNWSKTLGVRAVGAPKGKVDGLDPKWWSITTSVKVALKKRGADLIKALTWLNENAFLDEVLELIEERAPIPDNDLRAISFERSTGKVPPSKVVNKLSEATVHLVSFMTLPKADVEDLAVGTEEIRNNELLSL